MNLRYFLDTMNDKLYVLDEANETLTEAREIYPMDPNDVDTQPEEPKPVPEQKLGVVIGRRTTTCSICGEKGHTKRKCTNFESDTKAKKDLYTEQDKKDDDFEITDHVLEETEIYLNEGWGSKEIGGLWGVSTKKANEIIAKVRGIKL